MATAWSWVNRAAAFKAPASVQKVPDALTGLVQPDPVDRDPGGKGAFQGGWASSGSSRTNTPLSVWRRIRRPKACRSLARASISSSPRPPKGIPPRPVQDVRTRPRARARTPAGAGCSPGTSTPSRTASVPSRQAFDVVAENIDQRAGIHRIDVLRKQRQPVVASSGCPDPLVDGPQAADGREQPDAAPARRQEQALETPPPARRAGSLGTSPTISTSAWLA